MSKEFRQYLTTLLWWLSEQDNINQFLVPNTFSNMIKVPIEKKYMLDAADWMDATLSASTAAGKYYAGTTFKVDLGRYRGCYPAMIYNEGFIAISVDHILPI